MKHRMWSCLFTLVWTSSLPTHVTAQTNSLCPDPPRHTNRACLGLIPGSDPTANRKTFALNGRHEAALPANIFLTWDANWSVALWGDPQITLTAINIGTNAAATQVSISFSSIYWMQDTPTTAGITLRDSNGNTLISNTFIAHLAPGVCGAQNGVGPLYDQTYVMPRAIMVRDVAYVDLAISANYNSCGCYPSWCPWQ